MSGTVRGAPQRPGHISIGLLIYAQVAAALPALYRLTPFNFPQRVSGAFCLVLLRLCRLGSGIQTITDQTIRTNLERERER